jgi:N-acetylneuraminate synthase/sialic acid synthase
MAALAYVLGARVIEKHFTLNRAMKGTDHAFSLEPSGMKKLVRDVSRAREALGDGEKHQHASEEAPLAKMGKKLVIRHDLPAGHLLTADDIVCKSPGDGLWPYQLGEIVGRRLIRDVVGDEAVDFELIEL